MLTSISQPVRNLPPEVANSLRDSCSKTPGNFLPPAVGYNRHSGQHVQLSGWRSHAQQQDSIPAPPEYHVSITKLGGSHHKIAGYFNGFFRHTFFAKSGALENIGPRETKFSPFAISAVRSFLQRRPQVMGFSAPRSSEREI